MFGLSLFLYKDFKWKLLYVKTTGYKIGNQRKQESVNGREIDTGFINKHQ